MWGKTYINKQELFSLVLTQKYNFALVFGVDFKEFEEQFSAQEREQSLFDLIYGKEYYYENYYDLERYFENTKDFFTDEYYKNLEKSERKIVKRLGGILKLADGLNKEHERIIENIKIEYDFSNSIAKIILISNNKKPDISTAIRKRDLFEIGFKCQSVILGGNY